MAYGGDVTGPVPRCPNAEELAIGSRFARHAQAADIRDMHADEVDQTLPDERHVLGLIHEQLAHSDGRGGALAHQPEVLRILGRERVLEEEQVVGFEFSGEAYGLYRREAAGDVVEQPLPAAARGALGLE